MHEFMYDYKSSIDNKILDNLSYEQQISSLNLSIKASHAGKVNGNFVFYTPRSMRTGAITLVNPFAKHLQNLHKGDAVGVIKDAKYIDLVKEYNNPELQELFVKIDSATSPSDLVSAVKQLVNHPSYKEPTYKGLGVLQVQADLFDAQLIEDLRTKAHKGTVSIGGDATQVFCSICGSLLEKNHIHEKGRRYNGETCFAIFDNMKLDHIGFVPDPADSATETTIISDSLLEDNSITITYFKIQDNQQGNIMDIEQLKQFATDVNNLVNIEGLSDQQKVAFKEAYAAGKKYTRSSGFLLPDRLLPVTSKETTALSYKAIKQIVDESSKQGLLDTIQPYLEKFGFTSEQDVEEFIKNFGVQTEASVAEPTVDVQEGAQQLIEGAQGLVDENNQQAAESLTNFKLSSENFKSVLEEIGFESLVANAVEAALNKQVESKPAVIQDSVEYGLLLQHNKDLITDFEVLETVNNNLTNELKDITIKQILTLKGYSQDCEYALKLKERDLVTLKTTLEDVEFETLKTKPVINNEETDTTTQTAVTVEDSLSVGSSLTKITLQDNLTNIVDTSVVSDTNTQTELSDEAYINKYGLSAWLKSKK